MSDDKNYFPEASARIFEALHGQTAPAKAISGNHPYPLQKNAARCNYLRIRASAFQVRTNEADHDALRSALKVDMADFMARFGGQIQFDDTI